MKPAFIRQDQDRQCPRAISSGTARAQAHHPSRLPITANGITDRFLDRSMLDLDKQYDQQRKWINRCGAVTGPGHIQICRSGE